MHTLPRPCGSGCTLFKPSLIPVYDREATSSKKYLYSGLQGASCRDTSALIVNCKIDIRRISDGHVFNGTTNSGYACVGIANSSRYERRKLH